MSDFKIETKDAKEFILPETHTVKARAVVTDSDITCIHTVKNVKFCAPNSQLGETTGIDNMVSGIASNKAVKLKVEMGSNQFGAYEKIDFVDSTGKSSPVTLDLKAARFTNLGPNYRLLGVTKKE